MRYQMNGDVIDAISDRDVVDQLMKLSQAWQPSDDYNQFMLRFAEREKMMSGHVIRTGSVTHFVADLLNLQIIRPC